MNKTTNAAKRAGIIISISLLVVATLSFLWGQRYYGNITFAEIMFTLNMPLEGTAQSFVDSYFIEALFPSIAIIILIVLLSSYRLKEKWIVDVGYKSKEISLRLLPWKKEVSKHGSKLLVVWLVILLLCGEYSFQMLSFIRGQITKSEFIENHYVDPGNVVVEFPEEKKNLIYIIVESMESTLQDKQNGGMFEQNYISELTAIAKENISFSHSELIEGAVVAPGCGWTIAGIVAESAGIPLKLYTQNQDVDSSMGKYMSFLPGAVTLGEILEENGYRNYYMQGAGSRFGGKDNYLQQHGNYEIWDLHTAREKGKIPEDYFVWWGYEDAKLFQYAKEQLTEISKEDAPFNFTMLTVDSHHVNGYVCELCEDEYSEQYANVYQCVSRQVNEFVEWIKQQEFYENTTIVIAGDHCSMNGDFFRDENYDKYAGDLNRKVYNAFINTEAVPVNEENRKFTTLDFYPTIVASLGAKIEGNRLGLGVNLFSQEETLVEEYGYDYVFEELNKKSTFYDEELLYPKQN